MKLNVLCYHIYSDEYKVQETLNKIDSHYQAQIYNIDKVDKEDVLRHIVEFKPVVIYTIGNSPRIHNIGLETSSFEIRKRWIHYEKIEDFNPLTVIQCYIHSILDHPNQNHYPLISVLTTSYHSGDKILRPYNSLMNQTYKDWEWVIWDDSHDDTTYKRLVEFSEKDSRIRVFKAHRQNGWIGEMKEWAGRLCRGKWIVELDHDDEIIPQLFEWVVDIGKRYSDIGFIYSDFTEPYEGRKDSVIYNCPAYGFGTYVKKYTRGFYQNVYQTQGMNPYTVRHIVGVPNHVRIWRKDVYEEIGGHNPYLPVADDYELILRTFLKTRMCKIPELCYYQYRNTDGNFTFHRNSLIQHCTKWIYPIYQQRLTTRLEELGVSDHISKSGWTDRNPTWYYPVYDYPCLETIYKPSDLDNNYCISIVLSVDKPEINSMIQCIKSLLEQSYTNIEVYVIGNGCPNLEIIMNILTNIIDQNIITNKLRWFNIETSRPDLREGYNYALKTCVWTRLCLYLDSYKQYEKDYVKQMIDTLQQEDNKYVLRNKDCLFYTNLFEKYGYIREGKILYEDWDEKHIEI